MYLHKLNSIKLKCILIIAFVCVSLISCGPPPYKMETPDSFKRFEETNDFKMITADGVKLKVREVDNYPEADLEFWADAMGRHLESQGYVLKSKDKFETVKGLDSYTLDFLLPHGAEDWVLSETIFVVGETIILLEATGPFDLYTVVEEEMKRAIKTFDPNM